MNGNGTGAGLTIPEHRPYLIPTDIKRLLAAVDQLASTGRPVNVLVRGKQGCGKSELVAQYASRRNRPLAVLEVGRLSEASQIFGYMDLKDGQTTYVKGLFTEAITTPGAVIHLQEINRPESDKALNAIFSVLDDTMRSVWLDELRGHVKVAEGVTFFATLNEGYEFIGTMPLDAALANRFPFKLSLGYLPQDTEVSLIMMRVGVNRERAVEIVTSISQLRSNPKADIHISTRDVLYIAELISLDLTMMEALSSVIGHDQDTLESLLLGEHLSGRDNYGATAVTYELL